MNLYTTCLHNSHLYLQAPSEEREAMQYSIMLLIYEGLKSVSENAKDAWEPSKFFKVCIA